MDKKSKKVEIVTRSYIKLLESIESGNINAIKFALENLDEQFSIPYKELMTSLFKELILNINNFNGFTIEQKKNIIGIIKSTFDKYEQNS